VSEVLPEPTAPFYNLGFDCLKKSFTLSIGLGSGLGENQELQKPGSSCLDRLADEYFDDDRSDEENILLGLNLDGLKKSFVFVQPREALAVNPSKKLSCFRSVCTLPSC
jgi:hypothetical protein